MWGDEWAQLARIISREARGLIDEFRKADAPARLTVTVTLEVGGEARVCEVRMGAPQPSRDKGKPDERSSGDREDRRDERSSGGRSWSSLGARHGT